MAENPGGEQAPRLLGLTSAVTPAEYLVTPAGCMLGRDADCDIVALGPLISRLHARVARAGPRYWLSDAASRNGTFVNGGRITAPHLLDDNDLIGLGAPEALLRYVDPDRTALSRAPGAPAPAARLAYDPQAMVFAIDGRPIELSLLQLKLLAHLYQHAGVVCSRESCAEAIWARPYDHQRDGGALDQALSSLRRALGRGGRWIQTRRGLGYVLCLTGE